MIFIKKYIINDLECNVNITIKPKNKNIYLRVRNKIIYITTPIKLSDNYLINFISKNFEIIKEQLLKTPPIKSDTIHLFGKEYRYSIIKDNKNYVLTFDKTMLIHVKCFDEKLIQKTITIFYTNELKKIVELYESEIKKEFNINFNINYSYKNVKSYFGQCCPSKKKITFAVMLAKYELTYILSVIYHEMAHFIYLSHNMKFYNLLEQKFKNYKITQSKMKKIKYNDMY